MQTGLQLLKETHVGTLLPPDHEDIISFSKHDTIDVISKGLAQHHISSAPVYDPIKHTHTCFVDTVDLVSFFLSKFNDKGPVEPSVIDESVKTHAKERCSAISDLSGRNPFRPIEGMASLLSAITMMVNWMVHRVPVIDAEGNLLTVLTQSHVVRFIYSHMSVFGHKIADSTIEGLGMMRSPILTVTSEQKAIDAFKLMHEKRVSGVGVVNENGRLIGNISVSDLKYVGFDSSLFSRLYYPASQFIKLSAQDRNAEEEPPVFVKPQSTFAEVVTKLVNSRVHRAYVVDETFSPIGIVTQLEVLQALLKSLSH